jgi:hypothetical protein
MSFATTHAFHEQLLGLDAPLKQILDPKAASQTRARTLEFILGLHDKARARLLDNLSAGKALYGYG